MKFIWRRKFFQHNWLIDKNKYSWLWEILFLSYNMYEIYAVLTFIFKRLVFQFVILCNIFSLIDPCEEHSGTKSIVFYRGGFSVFKCILYFPLKDVIQNDSTLKRAWYKSCKVSRGLIFYSCKMWKTLFFLMI